VTANTFWQCVWEADVYLLIQLSDDFNYVPNTSDRCLEYGQVSFERKIIIDTCKKMQFSILIAQYFNSIKYGENSRKKPTK
jgi:hypothetical protein